jgi:hypothetical protein
MLLKAIIVLIVSVLEVITAEMTSQMHSVHMIMELSIVVEVFFAEITPGMR